MLQKSSTHWCHYSQGEKGPWWQHTWQLAELSTAIKLFGIERPDVFIKLVLTKLLLQQSFENHIYIFAKMWHSWVWKQWNTEQEKNICSWIKVFMSINENICVCMYILTHVLHMQTKILNYFHMELPAAAPKSWVSALSGVPVTELKMPKKRPHPP